MRTRRVLCVGLLVVLAACSGNSKPGSSAKSAGKASANTATTTTAAPAASLLAARPIHVHVPPGYSASKAAPLLVLLHGYGATGEIQSAYLGLTATADANGMLYVYPDGTLNPAGKRFWNATDACCARSGAAAVDDSAYISAIIANIRSTYNVDAKRVFIIGHSNGGFMAYRMACDHADVIAAVVSLEAATYADPSRCKPSQPVSVLEVHGLADDTILYAGGRNPGASQPYPGAIATVQTWAAYDGCSKVPDVPAPAPRPLVTGLPLATVQSYSTGCKPGGHVELWTQPGGPHIPRWSPTFDAQIVAFLLAHPKP